jgi:hypothetical protein
MIMKIKKGIISLLFIFLCVFSNKQSFALSDTLFIEGFIGKHPIEMQITSSDYETGIFHGRYRYLNQKDFLELYGENYQQCIFMEEYFGEDTTGYFYLDRKADSLNGIWMINTKVYQVNLQIVSGNKERLTKKSLLDYSKYTNNAISGSYGNEYHWVSDMWNSPEKPYYEIAFNGGYIIVNEATKDSIQFQLQVICGPTYHFAIASGMAAKSTKENEYVYASDKENGEQCVIVFKFGEKAVHVEAEYSWVCSFGARAYLNHDFIKISDKADFREDASLFKMKNH